MNRIVSRSAAAVVFTIIACAPTPPAAEQTTKASPIEGAWKIVDVTATGSDSAATNHSPQPSIVTFGPKYYSWLAITSAGPRALYKTQTPTDAERLAAFSSFVANSGTYDRTDSTVTIHPIVARTPTFVQQIYHVRIAGDTAWMQSAVDESSFRIGTAVQPDVGKGMTKYTLVRMK